MTTDPRLPPDQRKKLLIVQGQLFRLGVVEAQQSIVANLRPDMLVRSAVSSVMGNSAGMARQFFTAENLFNGRAALLLPVVAKTIGILSRRHLLRPAAIAAAVAATGYFGWQRISERRRARAQARTLADSYSGDLTSS